MDIHQMTRLINKHPMKKALLSLIVIVSIASQSYARKQGQEKIDSLFSVLRTAKEDTSKVNTLIALSYESISANPDTAVYFANEALALATKLKYKMGITDAHFTIGRGLINLGKFNEALENFNEVLILCDELLPSATTTGKLKILKRKGNAYNSIGGINQYQGNYHEALKNLFAALKIYQETVDKKGSANTYNNFGIIYYRLGNYPEALKNYLASCQIDEEIRDNPKLAGSYNNIGLIYINQGNYPEALKYYYKAMKDPAASYGVS
jgi:tetratricopeptide (TPR) repeat protein